MTRGPALDQLTAYVTRRAGLSFAGSRGPWLRDSVSRAMQRLGQDPADALRALESDPLLFGDFCAEVTVQESFFFRERRSLDLVRRLVLPARDPGRAFQVWSAGCAGGEEAYTLAAVLAEAGLGRSARVHATDLSAEAVRAASHATYGRWSLRGVDDEIIARCFTLSRDGWQVRDHLRSMVTVAQHNLLEPAPAPPGGFDLVLCRNVLIYLTPAAVRRVARHLAASLAPGGWLLTSASDPPLDDVGELAGQVTDFGIAYRRPEDVDAGAGATAHAPAVPRSTARTADAATARSTVRARDRRRAGWSRRAAEPSPAHAASPRAGADDLAAAARALHLGNPGEAERAARRALATGPTPEAHGLLVRALAELPDLAAAATEADRATSAFPLHAELHHLHALVLLETGDDRRALDAARRAVYLDPSSPHSHLVLARAQSGLGDEGAARRGRRNARRLIDSEVTS